MITSRSRASIIEIFAAGEYMHIRMIQPNPDANDTPYYYPADKK
jgi:hypothetical protein